MRTVQASPMTSLPRIAAIVLSLAAAAPAAAQQLGTNSRAPIDISSDHAEANNTDCVSTWTGNVEALQDNARLRSDVLKLFGSRQQRSGQGGSCGDIVRMEAQGSVYYVTPQQRVKGDNAVYLASNDTITVTGDVVAVQGRNVLRGKKMVINVKTGDGQMESDVTGRNKPGRVRGVFYPNEQSGNAQPPAASGRR